ncbi:MAG: rhodanese-like domain-containing protein [Bdellovibrionota bacterium]
MTTSVFDPPVIGERAALLSPGQLSELIATGRPVRLIHVCAPEQFVRQRIADTDAAISIVGEEFWTYKVNEDRGGTADFLRFFADYFRQSGITGDETLVFVESAHDECMGHSCRGWLFARLLGYDPAKLFVLNGGLAAWIMEARPTASGQTEFADPAEATTAFVVREDLIARRSDVVEIASGFYPGAVLLDVRGPDEWAGGIGAPGGQEPNLPAGRVPGSINLPWDMMFVNQPGNNPPTVFADPAMLEAAFEPLQIGAETPIVVMCYKAARASVVYLVLTEILGYRNVRIYLEGWSGYAASGASIEAFPVLPSCTRTFGVSVPEVAALHAVRARREERVITPDQNPGGYESVDMALIADLKERHRWLTKPLFRASNFVRHTPFYRWAAQLQSPEAFLPVARNLWHHSVTFPQVMGGMLARTSLVNHRLFGHYARHLMEEVEHHNWLAEWLVERGLIASDAELVAFQPTPETRTCIQLGWDLVEAGDPELWMVTLNSAIERLSNDLFKVLARRMRELSAGHRYFDVHVGADEFHSIMGLQYVEPPEPDSERARKLTQWALKGVTVWCDMLHSWIDSPFRVQFDGDGRIQTSMS